MADVIEIEVAGDSTEIGERIVDVIDVVEKGDRGDPGFQEGAIEVVCNGNGAVLNTGFQVDLIVPFDCTILGWTILADRVGSIEVDIWRLPVGEFPPEVGDSITGTAKPLIEDDQLATSETLTGWNTTLAKNDNLRFNIDSAETIKRALIKIQIQKPNPVEE